MITAYLKARPMSGKMQVMDTVHTGSAAGESKLTMLYERAHALAKRPDVAAVRVVEIPDKYENKPYSKKICIFK